MTQGRVQVVRLTVNKLKTKVNEREARRNCALMHVKKATNTFDVLIPNGEIVGLKTQKNAVKNVPTDRMVSQQVYVHRHCLTSIFLN